ncbi:MULTISPECIES: DUF4810 domain-containing protein [Pseudoalteromonas]|uniref:DUF4810 domain-containing protein n=1 Tax=Pseudoalteromonas amylolytica TaxID=1859457 RepID=A0A1S1MTR9_9GAMM|nr:MULTISPECIES: DUF4810 domain-containing protein [Pseudoalteromonas]OHU86374.1 hypothetical protein BFC16_15080 [Pseudoalteromonas sp. JW3]OHU89877.1 hypothetical protein BET10_17235 [Pseudoalteromonas amylolytica]
MKNTVTILAVIAAATLAGCKTVKPLYYHGSYNQNIYQHFKADETDVGEQINQLEETVQMAENNSMPIAPGILAHLGYLHLKQGNLESGFGYLEQEKALFPESAKYIDFLIKNAKGAQGE